MMPCRYPSELRRQVIELARVGTRVPQLASTFGMTEATIYAHLLADSELDLCRPRLRDLRLRTATMTDRMKSGHDRRPTRGRMGIS